MTQAMSLSQGQRLVQTQQLSVQQMQAMKLLQSTSLELVQEIRQRMELNPVIELHNPMEVLAGNPLEGAQERLASEKDRQLDALEHDETLRSQIFADSYDSDSSLDIERSSTWTSDDEEKRQFFFNSQIAPVSLQEQLTEQLRERVPDSQSPLFRAGLEVLGNLDDKGLLKATDEELAAGAQVDLQTAQEAVRIVQKFDPAGIGGRTPRELLLLQLDRANEHGDIAYEIVDSHLEELARNRLPQIAKALDVDLEEVQEAVERIRQLNPSPASGLAGTPTPTVVPDVIVRRGPDGSWNVRLNDIAFPSVTLNHEYEQMHKEKSLPKEARPWLTEKVEEARGLVNNLDFRRTTIGKIAEAIVALQLDFFEKGESALKPLVQATVAERVGVHETTVSRAIANKYMDTPWGVFEFQHFFSRGFVRQGNEEATDGEGKEEVSSRTIRLRIREMVENEDPVHPLSDQAMADRLAAEGIKVARRTVMKYREAEGIRGTSIRRKFG
ncbi:MAG: RNA polymerase factor sigma-54 [Victivallales bacterium]|nr:RNA polymerase factor sigma-54 [Victivallales bacterium]